MIELDLTQQEQTVFAKVLEDYLSDLRMEIADTDSYDFRQRLKFRKSVIMKVLDTLRPAEPANQG